MQFPFDINDIIAWKYYCSTLNPEHGWRKVLRKLLAPPHVRSFFPEVDPFILQAVRVETDRRRSNGLPGQCHRSSVANCRTSDRYVREAIELGLAVSGNADMIRAYLLANHDPRRIANVVGLHENVIVWFEKLFFHVGDHLDNWTWFDGIFLGPMFEKLDNLDRTSEAYAEQVDRILLFQIAFRTGTTFFKRIVHPSWSATPGTKIRLVSDSPIVRFQKWLWTPEDSLPLDLLLMEKISKLFANIRIDDETVDRRINILLRLIDRHEGKRPVKKQADPRPEQMVKPDNQVPQAETQETLQASRGGVVAEHVPLGDAELNRDVQAA